MRAARAALLGFLLLVGIGGGPVVRSFEDGSAVVGWEWSTGRAVMIALPGTDGGDIHLVTH